MYHSLSLLPGRHGLVLGIKDDEDIISALGARELSDQGVKWTQTKHGKAGGQGLEGKHSKMLWIKEREPVILLDHKGGWMSTGWLEKM